MSCLNSLLNNFDLSAWTEIDNDISKSEDLPTEPKTEKPKLTTSTPASTTKTIKTTRKPTRNKISNKKPPSLSLTTTKTSNNLTKHKPGLRLNKTETDHNLNKTKQNLTLQKIDDKLDFKNKSKRFENVERSDNDRQDYRKKPNKQYNDYDYEDDDSQGSQAVVINNLSFKRPTSHHRPVIAVTENVDKYTYLINYVPRPTQSWRRNTKTPYPDRDVVKVTYQTYDDTYHRRPNRPYFSNRQDEISLDMDEQTQHFRYNKPDKTTKRQELMSSARSNDDSTTATPLTDKQKDKPNEKMTSTTENYKLITFRYVGTYKGHNFNETSTTNDKTEDSNTNKTNKVNMSKDFSTYKRPDKKTDQDPIASKLSTFFMYESATRPYNYRPTRLNDEHNLKGTNDKYYYVKNVLHKYPDIDSTLTEKPNINNDFVKENYNNPGTRESYYDTEERSSIDKLAFLEDVESAKSADANPKKDNQKKSSHDSAKTPSVAFQVIPSENR